MNPNTKQGNITMEVVVLLIAVIFTSALVLTLIQSGFISVKAQNKDVLLLNTEFIPVERPGTLVITNFNFCHFVNEQYECWEPGEEFILGEEVHFRFSVESSVWNGNVLIVENYRVKDPQGRVLLDVDQKNSFTFEAASAEKEESITFKDYFTINPTADPGEYTLELVITNPLLDKRATVTKTFLERGVG